MEMLVHLHPDVYEIVDKESKDVEARVNDEKRRKLSIGDTLIFINRADETKKIKTIVKDLKYFNTFEDIGDNYDMGRLYLSHYTKEMWLKELHRFYNDEQIKKYGVVAIEFKKIEE